MRPAFALHVSICQSCYGSILHEVAVVPCRVLPGAEGERCRCSAALCASCHRAPHVHHPSQVSPPLTCMGSTSTTPTIALGLVGSLHVVAMQCHFCPQRLPTFASLEAKASLQSSRPGKIPTAVHSIESCDDRGHGKKAQLKHLNSTVPAGAPCPVPDVIQ